MENNYNIILHPYQKGYIGETTIEESKSGKYSDYELIFIVDRSGSMSRSYPILINKIIPYLLDKLKFPENKQTHFITFEDYVDYRKFTKKDFLNCTEPAPGAIEKMSDVFPKLREIFIPKNEKTPFRILTLSDGELVVQKERQLVPKLASQLSEDIKGKFRINSQAIRYFTSEYGQPDTLALASILQLNSAKEATLIDIKCSDSYIEAGDRIYELFKNDGFDCSLTLKSNKECIRTNPWAEPKGETQLFIGKNFFWLDNFDDKTEFRIKINEEEEQKMAINKGEEIDKSNYGIILAQKISEYLNKLKVLKIVNTEKSQKEIEQIVSNFKKFEENLETKEKEEDFTLKDGKMASRIIYLQKLINKRKGLISNQMDKIKNENRLSELNSQQKADYLRSVDSTKLGKSLAKRALNTGENLNDIVVNEIENVAKHIDELNNMDYSSHPSSFYSTCTTLESLRDISKIKKEPFFEELDVTDILKLFNVVGIACNGKVGEYPDPSVYLVKTIYPGCYISMADIATAEEYTKGNKHLEVPGTKEEINNCIPIFSDEKIYNFLKYSPKILELLAGLGMRRVLAEIPLTFESLILSGLWKMIGILKGNKSEINIKCFLDICNSMKYVCGKKYNNVVDIIKKQLNNKDSKNGLYINNYGLFPMLTVLYNCAKDKTFNKDEMKKILRAIIRFEIYKLIRAKIRKAEKKDDFIKESLNAALGIDFEKYGTKLSELFQKKVDPEFCDQFYINKTVIKEYLKSVGWTELIPYSYILFSASLEPDPIESLKNVKEYKKGDICEELGISYDFDKFLIFNVVQSYIYKEKIDRDNEKEKVMKIMDSNNEEEVDNFLKGQVKHIYAAEYTKENQKQIKKQLEIISSELVNKIISAKDLSEFNLLMKDGITKGYLNHKLSNESSKGYIDLKKKLLDEKEDIPLRYEKLKAILSGKNEKGEVLWNNGNPIRTKRKDYQLFIQKNKPEIWEEISKSNLEHKYREKINRQGHSNSKKSYWARGFETLQDFYELSKKNDVEEYKKVHNNCCGLGVPEKRLKNLKKVERKKKRKEFREKRKNSEMKIEKKESEKKVEEDKDEEIMVRGRGRYRGRGRPAYGRRHKVGRRGGISRGRGGAKVEEPHMEIEGENDDDKNEIFYDEKDEMDEEVDEPIVGRKKKRTVKKLKHKEKEEKKMVKKIAKFNKK